MPLLWSFWASCSSAWERGLVLPNQLEQNLREIILGLIDDDEDQRWGYREVKHWSEGYFIRKTVQPDGFRRRRGEKPVRPLIFGRFSGQTVAVATLEQLAGAIRNHWEHTGRLFKRLQLNVRHRLFHVSVERTSDNIGSSVKTR